MFKKYLEEQGKDKEHMGEFEYYAELSKFKKIDFEPNITVADLNEDYISDGFKVEVLKKYKYIPKMEEDSVLHVLTSTENTYELLSHLRVVYRDKKIKLIQTTPTTLSHLIIELFDKSGVLEEVNKIEVIEVETDKVVNLDEQVQDGMTAKKYVLSIMRQALKEDASDIHIDPGKEIVDVKMRIDGRIYKQQEFATRALSSVIATLKLMSNLNISESRLPQDGQFSIQLGSQTINIRVAIINTIYGEKATLRILNGGRGIKDIKSLNMGADNEDMLREMSNTSNGIILVTGATGSGKSTTLLALMNTINTGDKTIITVEDPAENIIDGAIQIEVDTVAGRTFEVALRSILRLDPDIIMIGEIRDEITASIAIKAAITGHIVYASLHTNSTINTIARLKDMKVEQYLVADALRGVLNQRLVGRLCTNCAKDIDLPKDSIYRKAFEIPEDEEFKCKEAVGCDKCRHSGYKGRVLLTEMLPITPEIRKLIENGEDLEKYPKMLEASGYKSIKKSALERVREGATDFKEVINV